MKLFMIWGLYPIAMLAIVGLIILLAVNWWRRGRHLNQVVRLMVYIIVLGIMAYGLTILVNWWKRPVIVQPKPAEIPQVMQEAPPPPVEAVKAVEPEKGVEKESTDDPRHKMYLYVLETPIGNPGLNKGESVITQKARVIRDDKEVLAFTVYYNENDDTETVDYYMDRTGGKNRLGVWKQVRPESSGQWELTKIQTISGGYCLRVNRRTSPDIWANVYIYPDK